MNTKENLLACAEYLEENGWCQFDPVGGPDLKSQCSVAVMDEIANRTNQWTTAYTGMRDALVAHLGITRGAVARWNDQPERTKEEVIAAFRGAAESVAS